MSFNSEHDALIGSFQHESHRPRADQALHNLKKIASIVKPIMRRRGWHVGMLAEFFPDQGNLLGLNTNHGQIINLRLRYKNDHTTFLPLEEVVDTMLHELCHNEIGPHNEQFHALWDQLRDEHEALVRKGYTGEGFLGRGERLGGQRIPLHEAKRRARAAAERRRNLTASSGQRLGGTGIQRGDDVRAIIAAAASRRIRVERGCASGTDAGRQIALDETIKKEEVTTTRAEREDENEATLMQAYIDLIEEEESAKFGADYIPPSAENPAGPRAIPTDRTQTRAKTKSLIEQQRTIEQGLRRQTDTPSTSVSQSPFSRSIPQAPPRTTQVPKSTTQHTSTRTPFSASSPLFSSNPPRPANEELDTWTCEVCTLVNPINYLTCDACTVERPQFYSLSSSPPSPRAQSVHSQSTKQSQTRDRNRERERERERPSALKPRLTSTQAYEKFERERMEKVNSRPLGWTCRGCGTFVEMEWWTCNSCGRMKESS